MNSKSLIFIVYVFVVALFSSCDKNRVYENYQTFQSAKWNKDSVATFQFVVFDIKQKYNLYINIRNDINYNYSNLWLLIDTEQPDGKTVQETKDIVLAEVTGKWLGKGFGGTKYLQVKLHQDYIFSGAGIYKIKIKHGMRDDVLKGICDIGVRVEKRN